MEKKFKSKLRNYVALIIVILIIVSYVIYYIIKLYESKTEAFEYSSHILLSKIDEHIKFGDVLLFSSNCKDMLLQFYHMSLFSHCGMVVKLGSEYYILEANADRPYRLKEKIGYDITFNPLHERIQNYNGQVYLLKLNKDLTAEMKLEILKELRDRKFKYPFNIPNVIRSLFSSSDRYFHCYGIVNYLMTKIGIMERKGFFNSSLYINDAQEKDLSSEYKYEKQIHIVQDRIDLCNKACEKKVECNSKINV